ncbi:MAG: hypothetical protein IJ077_08670 [Eubacterium sp.]|nr:hypothetical protein [Alphaproteobacteria bacterium]MBQ8981666.1 hypothetical protein [Eubacterium sp.]
MTEETKKELAVVEQKAVVDVFSDINVFANAKRICMSLVKSDIVPQLYRGSDKLSNAMIALEMANRLKISPLAVMQNMYVVQGRPTWASSFIIAMINNSGKFSGLKFKYGTNGTVANMKLENKTCRAYATDKATGEVVYGPEVSMQMAVNEGWYGKTGSKWKTLPELMLSYRAAAFFGRLYVPEIMQGMHTDDEVEDSIEPQAPEIVTPAPTEEPKKRKTVKKPDINDHKDDVKMYAVDAEFEPVEEPAPAVAEPMNEEEQKVAAVIEPVYDFDAPDAPFAFDE